MKLMVELELNSREEELLKKVIANDEKLGIERSQEHALTDTLQTGTMWDTYLYEKMSNYLFLMGGCTYEESKDMLDEYKKDLNVKYESYQKVHKLFKSLPISWTDFTLTTGKRIEAEADMDYIIKTWNACNTEEGKYLINTKDNGIEYGLKSHSLLQEGTVTYEDLKRDMIEGMRTETDNNKSCPKLDENITKLYEVIFEKNGIGQSNLVSTNKDIDTIKDFFKQVKGCAEVYGVREASSDGMRPGKPIVTIPEDFVKTGLEEKQQVVDDGFFEPGQLSEEEVTDLLWNGSMYSNNIEPDEEEMEPGDDW